MGRITLKAEAWRCECRQARPRARSADGFWSPFCQVCHAAFASAIARWNGRAAIAAGTLPF